MTPEERRQLLADGACRVREACEFTGLSRAYLYQLMDSGRLPYVHVGRARLIPRRALLELLESGWRR